MSNREPTREATFSIGAPAIQLAPGSKAASEEIRDWNAERDFVGDTAGRSMEGWEKFAQVLLETNELAFVN